MTISESQVGVSLAPDGTRYPLPDEVRSAAEVESLRRWAAAAGRPVVVVQGVGFVGSAMAVAVAASKDRAGSPRYSVLGVDLPQPTTFWKSCRANEGHPPADTTDEELIQAHRNAVKQDGNLRFTWVEEAYALADTIVVDINLDVQKHQDRACEVDLAGFERSIRTLGQWMRPDTLVLVESTVPPGTCTRLVEPALREEIRRRGLGGEKFVPLLAHSYERVMPGPNYLGSITRIWRVYAGNTPAAAERAAALLGGVIDTKRYPLTQLADTTSSEMAKVLENSYRAANIALIHEWTRLAEAAGVDLFAVIEAIRKRKGTHDNIRYPGFGVGGYCLTKDALLADWAARESFGMPGGLEVASEAVRINDVMPAHTFQHVKALLGNLHGKRIVVLGVSYLAGVADTRATPTGLLVDLIQAEGGMAVLCDPLVRRWEERPHQKIFASLFEVPGPLHAVVFAIPHAEFQSIEPESLVRHAGGPIPIVDAQRVISDANIGHYQRLGCELRAVGRGNIR